MLTTFFRALLFLLIPGLAAGQSLNLSVSPQTSDNNTSTFLLDGDEISVDSSTLHFLKSGNEVQYQSFGVSADYSQISVLQWTEEEGEITLYDPAGNQLNSYSTITLGDEASFGVYPFNNGDVLLRDKIASFTFYDTFGDVFTSTSTSSQSEEGEAISEVAMSRSGETVVLYSPQIKRSGERGSQAQVMTADNEFEDIFFSSDRYLENVIVSDDGNIIVALTAKDGTNDEALIMDRFGNELNRISAEEDLIGASITNDAEHITLYSGGRVMVYSLTSGESLGATSFQSPILVANYFPSDNVILALTGSYSDNAGVLNNAEFRAVNLEQRSIASQAFSEPLGFHEGITPRLVRVSAGNYRLEGGSKMIEINANF